MLEGVLMLNVMMGVGVRVRVVKEETVIPLNRSEESLVLEDEVITTAECGMFRMI